MTVITPVRCDRQLYTCSLDLLVACSDASNIPDLKDNAMRWTMVDALHGRDFSHLRVHNLSFPRLRTNDEV